MLLVNHDSFILDRHMPSWIVFLIYNMFLPFYLTFLLPPCHQIFLFGLITNFSPLTCSIVTTTRKFFTVLFSIIVFGHSMTTCQWIGTVLIFSGLLLDQIYGKTRPKQSSNNTNNINGTVNSVKSHRELGKKSE